MSNGAKAALFIVGMFVSLVVLMGLFFVSPALALGLYALLMLLGGIYILYVIFKGMLDIKDKFK